MSITVFVIQNQQGLYLSKQQEWVDGTDPQGLYRTRHRDEAINTVFEVSSRDIHLRAETVICTVDAKANPILATAEPVTAAKAAQIARQQNADLDDANIGNTVEETTEESAGDDSAATVEPIEITESSTPVIEPTDNPPE